ncbi:MAG: hypothetical protein RL285_1352, partial [Bacteroidota bacterium]
EYLRRETRDAFEDEAFALGEGIANFEIARIVQTHHIAGISIVHHLLGLGQEHVRVGEFHLLLQSHVFEVFIAFEFARADPQKGNAIAVFWVEVGVYFENKAREFGFIGFDFSFGGGAGQWIGGYFDEGIEQLLYTETVQALR